VSTILPIATRSEAIARAKALIAHHRRALSWTLLLHASAAAAGLAAPQLVGRMVDTVQEGIDGAQINRLGLILMAALITQTVLTRFARLASSILGETILADLREDFMKDALALPLGTVERAGTGDLLARTTSDVDAMGMSVRFALPETVIALLGLILTSGAMLLVSPTIAVPAIFSATSVYFGTRWYLKRAPLAYQLEREAHTEMNAQLAETTDGATTVEFLSLQERRIEIGDGGVGQVFKAERRTLFIRCVWFPSVELVYILPTVIALVFGGWLYTRGSATLGEVTAIALYTLALEEPLDRAISWLDELQVGATSLARIIGIGSIPSDRQATGAVPENDQISADQVTYAYREGHDVLHGIDLHLAPGERLAIVGPSGAGKSTLGRLLAGIHPPKRGSATVGGVPLVDLPLDHLRTQVALVTQEHHVFLGTIADNLRLARPGSDDLALWGALEAVDAREWVESLPEGLATPLGGGEGLRIGPARAQQLALARLVLADPHTLVLDEATSLLDPRAARHLERSMAAVLQGRTVVAIAHRLHTAHDADRVAVVEDGRITEIGSHDELVAKKGAYAALWASWQS
jgi:ABC-type multidrug transport system fused ATPase/permease subunit